MGDILIVDGNPQRAMQLAQMLKELGANTRIAGSFFDCLKRIEDRIPISPLWLNCFRMDGD